MLHSLSCTFFRQARRPTMMPEGHGTRLFWILLAFRWWRPAVPTLKTHFNVDKNFPADPSSAVLSRNELRFEISVAAEVEGH